MREIEMALKGLPGKIAVVTGASGGIGSAAVARLLDEGCKVVAVDLDAARLEESFRGADPDRFLAAPADVSRTDGAEHFMRQAVERFGGVDLFVNNAGIMGKRAALVDCAVEEFDRVIAVNLRGVFLGLKAVLKQMIAQGRGGAIVNTSSVGGLKPNRHSGAYGPSKAAVISLTQIAALENAEHAIRVNAVCPGATDTGMLAQVFGSRESAAAGSAGHPFGRMARPGEIADLMAYLLSEEASFQTGGIYRADGGLLLT